jgi:hypothetical protein
MTYGWGYDKWDDARFDAIKRTHSAADTLSLTDAIKKTARLRLADTLSLLDDLRKVIEDQLADSLGLSDSISPRSLVLFQDSAALADSILALFQAVQGDAVTLVDNLNPKLKINIGNDRLSLSDEMQENAQPLIGDAIAVADAITQAVSAFRTDTLSLADTLATRTEATLTDTMALVDALIEFVGKTDQDSAASLADAIARKISPEDLADTLASLTDDFSLEPKPKVIDSTTIADAIIARVEANLTDLLSTVDDIKAAVEDAQGDSAAPADDIAIETRRIIADTLTLADAIVTGYGTSLLKPGTFEFGKFDESKYDDTGDYVETSDTFSWERGLGILGQDLLSIADAIQAHAEGYHADTLALVDNYDKDIKPNSGDTTGLTESLAVAFSKTIDELLSLSDNLLRTVAFTISDNPGGIADQLELAAKPVAAEIVLNLDDDYKMEAMACLADIMNLSDTSLASVVNAVNDVGTLNDVLVKKVGAILEIDEISTLTDNLALAVTLGVISDSVGLADRIDNVLRLIVGASFDMVAWDNAAFDTIGELIPVVDTLNLLISSALSESLNVDEEVQASIKLKYDETISLVDNLLAIYAIMASSDLPLSDTSNIETRKTTAEDIPLVEALTMKAGLNVAEAIAAVDIFGVLNRRSAAETIDLMDEIARLYRYVLGTAWDSTEWDTGVFDGTGDQLNIADSYRFAVAALVQDAIAANEQLKAAVSADLGIDTTGNLSDDVQLGIIKAAAESMGVSDTLLQLIIGLRKDTPLSLAELLSKNAGLPSDDSSTVADSIIAALILARKVDDLVTAVDDLVMEVKKVLKDAAVLTDSFALSTARGIQEAYAVAEALGIKTKRTVASNGVGIIDELRLKCALGIARDVEGVADSIRGKVKTILQQVFINGVSIPVNGLTISHSGKDRVSTAAFKISSPTAEVLNLAKQRAPVTIYLADGVGNTDYFGGRIVRNPTEARGTMTTEMEVTVDDWTAASLDVYVSESFANGFGTIDGALKYLWTKYYGYEIDLSRVEATGKDMPSMVFNYVPLFAVTEQLAQLLGWSWHVEYNGAGRVLQFYPPASAVQPISLSREARNIVAGTARFGQDDAIANVVYVFGGQGISNPYTQRILADGENTIYKLGSKPHRLDEGSDGGVIVTLINPAGTRFTQRLGIMNLHEAEDFDVLLDFNEATLRWRDDNKPAKGWVIEGLYRYTYPIMVQLTDDTSIKQYGRIETTVNDSSIKDPVAARDLGRAILRDRAYPKGFGSCEVYVPGLRAGQFITVDLPAYNTKGLFEITEVEKWIQGTTVRRRVTLNVADNAESRIAQRLKDFAKRLASLEAANRQEDMVVQRWLQGPARNIGASATGRVKGFIQDTMADTSQPLDAFVLTWKATGKAETYASETVLAMESFAKKPKPKKADTVTAADNISGGITFFDIHKFGDASHPWGL